MASLDNDTFKRSAAALALRHCNNDGSRTSSISNAPARGTSKAVISSFHNPTPSTTSDFQLLSAQPTRRPAPPPPTTATWGPNQTSTAPGLSTVFLSSENQHSGSGNIEAGGSSRGASTSATNPTASIIHDFLGLNRPNFGAASAAHTPSDSEEPHPLRTPPPLPTPTRGIPNGAPMMTPPQPQHHEHHQPAGNQGGGTAFNALNALKDQLSRWKEDDDRTLAARGLGEVKQQQEEQRRSTSNNPEPRHTPFISPNRPDLANGTIYSDVTITRETPARQEQRRAGSEEVIISPPTNERHPQRPEGLISSAFADRMAHDEVRSALNTPIPMGNRMNDVREQPMGVAHGKGLAAANEVALGRLDALNRQPLAVQAMDRAPPTADRLDVAANDRMMELERRLTNHQNEHVRQRATIGVAVDKARYELDQSEFRQAELHAHLESLVHALRERVGSRFATVSQLREDGAKQIQSQVKSMLKAIPRSHTAAELDQKKLQEIDSFRQMLEQYRSHMDVQTSLLEQHLVHGIHDSHQRIKGVLHVVSNNERDTITSMHSMIGHFSKQTRDQLAELKKDRERFEAHFHQRLESLRDQARRASGAGTAL